MKLSETLTEYRHYDYFPDEYIAAIQALEEKAASWDMLEKLPDSHGLLFDKTRWHDHKHDWEVFLYEYGCGTMNVTTITSADTPAEALTAYWKKKNETKET
jgi:hypothetical protein